MILDDRDFLTRFEHLTLPLPDFDHAGHLRLAWLYLQTYPLDRAIDRTLSGISAYAASQGAATKFHHTLTEAVVRIMYQRHAASGETDFPAWLAANADLLGDFRGVLARYYSDRRLYSEAARREWMAPDIRPIESTSGGAVNVYYRKAG